MLSNSLQQTLPLFWVSSTVSSVGKAARCGKVAVFNLSDAMQSGRSPHDIVIF